MREAAACVSFALVDIDLVLVFLSLLLQSIITTDNLTTTAIHTYHSPRYFNALLTSFCVFLILLFSLLFISIIYSSYACIVSAVLLCYEHVNLSNVQRETIMRLWFARDIWRYRNVFWLIDWLIDWLIMRTEWKSAVYNYAATYSKTDPQQIIGIKIHFNITSRIMQRFTTYFKRHFDLKVAICSIATDFGKIKLIRNVQK